MNETDPYLSDIKTEDGMVKAAQDSIDQSAMMEELYTMAKPLSEQQKVIPPNFDINDFEIDMLDLDP